MTFHIIYKTKHGDTTAHDDPKRAAYNYIAKCRQMGYVNYRLTCHIDDCFTVAIDGLASATFEKVT